MPHVQVREPVSESVLAWPNRVVLPEKGMADMEKDPVSGRDLYYKLEIGPEMVRVETGGTRKDDECQRHS